jgi:hypothetical protein
MAYCWTLGLADLPYHEVELLLFGAALGLICGICLAELANAWRWRR